VHQINSLASNSKFVQRRGGKLSPLNFLTSVCSLAIDGKNSLRPLATVVSLAINDSISKQGLSKRMNSYAANFLLKLIACLIKIRMPHIDHNLKDLSRLFSRIIIQDSTNIALNKSFFNAFPGSANQSGSSSSMRIQAAFNILDSSFTYFDFTSYRENDHKAAHKIDFIQPGDLLIRDLGYFSAKVFKKISDAKAYFISRLRFDISIYDKMTEEKISIYELIKNKTKLDIEILLGSVDKFPVRLVGIKLPKNVADRRKHRAKQDSDTRKNHSKEYMKHLEWNLYVTNIPESMGALNLIIKLYAIRWRIEIIFKSWKSCMNFTLKGNCSEAQLLVLVYSRIIVTTLLTNYYFYRFEQLIYKKSGKALSLIKFIDTIMSHNKYFDYFEMKSSKEKSVMLEALIKHATYERRNKQINYSQELTAILKLASTE